MGVDTSVEINATLACIDSVAAVAIIAWVAFVDSVFIVVITGMVISGWPW